MKILFGCVVGLLAGTVGATIGVPAWFLVVFIPASWIAGASLSIGVKK